MVGGLVAAIKQSEKLLELVEKGASMSAAILTKGFFNWDDAQSKFKSMTLV